MTSTSAATPTLTPARPRRLAALAKAEYRQFRRNTTLIFMATAFPIGIPLAVFLAQRGSTDDEPMLAATTFELFAFQALLFVQYYSVLSLVTTRRGEGVLKRLRTGESADWQIQAAPAVPGALLMVAGTAAVAAVVYASGAPAPVNPVAMAVAIAGGLVLFSLLALVTSAFTRNAEAAQITSIPVIAMATIGLGSIRGALPDRLAELAQWTPFAAVSDMIHLGAVGQVADAGDSAPVLGVADTFTEMGRPVATLAVWTVVALALVSRYFRWDDRS